MSLEWLIQKPIANRGLHDMNKTLWENTLPAFELAALRGYTICCDVQLSRDGVPMIFHGVTLERLTSRHERIIDLSVNDIRKITIGTSKQSIIPLETMLEDINGKADILVNIEGNEGIDAGLITSVADLLTAYSGNAAFMSKDTHILRRFTITGQNVPHGLLGAGVKRQNIEDHFAMLAHDVHFVAYKSSDLTNPFTRFARQKLDIPVLAYGIQSEEERTRVAALSHQIIFNGFFPKKQ